MSALALGVQRASNFFELEVVRGEWPVGLRQHIHRRRLDGGRRGTESRRSPNSNPSPGA